jgi:glycosyltransferase involved in cell wall biosynthesis
MKIVQVQTQAEAGGAQRISDMVGEGLRARGHEVRTVFMYRKTDVYDRDPHADFILERPPGGFGGQVQAVAGLLGYLRRARPDVVLSFQHYGNIFGTIGARLAGTRTIIANQSGAPETSGVRGLLTAIDRLMGTLGAYQLNVVNSAWTEARFDAFPRSYRQRLRRIDHGVPGPEKALSRTAARAAFGLPESAWLAVSSGRLSASKNQIALVQSLSALPDVHLAIAGAGPEREALLACADSQGLRHRLHLVGEVPPARIFEFLAAGDAYLFASRTETFGLAVVEAALAGLPVVCGDLPVLREVLTADDGTAAALFVPANAHGIAGGMAQLMADPACAAGLAGAGRQLAKRYAPARMCDGYEALLAPDPLRTAAMPSITSSAPQRLSV